MKDNNISSTSCLIVDTVSFDRLFMCKLGRTRISPSGGDWGDPSPPLPEKMACPPLCPPTVLTQKCQFCNFHAVFGHFVQTAPPPVNPIWETLRTNDIK